MGGIKTALSAVVKSIGKGVNALIKESKPAPPQPSGTNASKKEISRVNSKKKATQERIKKEKAKKDQRLVIDGAQIQCTLCSNPLGTLLVTYDTPSIQGKKTATVKDKGKMNLLFSGTCMKSPNAAAPCMAVIQPLEWQNTGSFQVQNESPLLQKSTIKCMFGGTDISIKDCGQRNIYAYDMPSPHKDEPVEEANINFTLFFDGTRNNMKNTEAREEYMKLNKMVPYDTWKGKANTTKAEHYEKMGNKRDDSYESGYSNVALLSKAFIKELKDPENYRDSEYVEGIATGNREVDAYVKDSRDGYAWGEGDTGIEAKVEKGSEYAAEKIKKLVSKGQKNDTIIINVFGFSRGAAAARSFLNEINKPATSNMPKHGVFGQELNKRSIDLDTIHFQINFAGLFDTVSSHGYVKSNDAKDLGLTAVKKARRTLHLVAADEHRYFFPLVNIKSAGFVEKTFPGVHSDIGGSYVDNVDENKKALSFGLQKFIESKYIKLVQDGWFKKEELHILPEKMLLRYLYDYAPDRAKSILQKLEPKSTVLKSERKNLSVAYSYIPLHIMCDFALQRGLSMKFNDEGLKDDFNINKHPRLEPIYKRLYDIVFENAPEMTFYSRQELEKEMDALRPDNKKKHFISLSKTTDERVYELEPEAGLPIQIESFITDPELKQKIQDHNALLWLRNEYLHCSADWLEPGFNPSVSGNRGIFNG